jgi:hypothetical protein
VLSCCAGCAFHRQSLAALFLRFFCPKHRLPAIIRAPVTADCAMPACAGKSCWHGFSRAAVTHKRPPDGLLARAGPGIVTGTIAKGSAGCRCALRLSAHCCRLRRQKDTCNGKSANLPFKAGGTPTDPNRQIRIGAATIALYYYKARAASESIAALGRKIRADAGKRWSLSESLLAVLKAQYDTSQRWNIQLHY